MDISKIPAGKDLPNDFNVIIEVAQGSAPVKYELDKDSSAIFVDRFMPTAMHYPANYGFVPHTLSDDGDPCDVLVIAPNPIVSGGVVRCRAIGVLLMEDESGMDEKILAVPVSKLTKMYEKVNSYTDLPEIQIKQITHFFESYKGLEEGKWVKVTGWADAAKAKSLIVEAFERAKK